MLTLEQGIQRASERFGSKVEPCAGKNWHQCITIEVKRDRTVSVLWFNTPDHSTHVLILDDN